MHVTGDPTYDLAFTVAMGIVVLTVLGGLFVKTPYGRFADDRLGLSLDPRLGWFLMELPATVTFLYFYFQGPNRYEPVPLFILFVWCIHYANRGWIMPALMRVAKGQKGTFGIMVVTIGWVVTSLHGYLNATWASSLSPHTGAEWFTDPRFLVGVVLYFGALALNIHSDAIIRNLRTKDEVARGVREYRMPKGGLFEYVTSASYFTELVFWIGFALFTQSPGGLFIFCISAANLVPRAVQSQKWYREKFPDYPAKRKILIPFVW